MTFVFYYILNMFFEYLVDVFGRQSSLSSANNEPIESQDKQGAHGKSGEVSIGNWGGA